MTENIFVALFLSRKIDGREVLRREVFPCRSIAAAMQVASARVRPGERVVRLGEAGYHD